MSILERISTSDQPSNEWLEGSKETGNISWEDIARTEAAEKEDVLKAMDSMGPVDSKILEEIRKGRAGKNDQRPLDMPRDVEQIPGGAASVYGEKDGEEKERERERLYLEIGRAALDAARRAEVPAKPSDTYYSQIREDILG